MEKEKELNKYKHLYKHSKLWNLLSMYIRLMHNLFYKDIIVEGKQNVPNEGPLLFAPNHQNALMDALAVTFSVNKQI